MQSPIIPGVTRFRRARRARTFWCRIGACSGDSRPLVALFLLGGATGRAAARRPSETQLRRRPASAPARRRATPATRSPPGSIPATPHARPATRSSPGATRVDAPRHDPPLSPLLQRLAQHATRRGCASAARAEPARLRRAVGPRLGLDRRHAASASSARTARSRRSDAALRFIAPDDGNATTGRWWRCRSTARSRRAKRSTSQIAWTSRVPRTFARTGAIGDYYFIAQWFPKIGVLEDTGWNCHQFHSRDRVLRRLRHLRRPADGAGRLDRRRDRRRSATATRRGATARTTHRFYQEDVHDFAWTTSPDYVERRATFEHPTLPAVDMRLLLQPEHAGQADRHFDATRAALKYYGEWFGAVSVRPHHDRRSGVAERAPAAWSIRRSSPPGTRWLAPRGVDRSRKASRCTKPVTSSGTASSRPTSSSTRGWTKGSTRSRPRASIEQALHAELLRRSGTSAGSCRGCSATSRCAARSTATGCGRTGSAPKGDAQSTPTWRYWPGTAGVDHLQQDGAVAAHARAHARLGHAAAHPVDLLRAVRVPASEAAGLLRRRQRGERTRPDVVLRPGLPQLERVRLRRRRASAASRRPSAATSATGRIRRTSGDRDGPYRTTVVVRRFGEGVFPVDVRVVFENGEEVRWHWDGRDRWKLFEIDKPVARRVRRGRSGPRAAARRATTRTTPPTLAPKAPARGAQVVARLAGLAAGSPADLRVLRLMPATAAFRDGIRRVNGAPVVRGGHVRGHAARRAAAVVRAARHDRGAPRARASRRRRRGRHELRLVAGVLGAGPGLGTTFVPSIIGFGAVLDNLSGLLDNPPLAATIAGATAAWLVIWSFLSGGVIDRLARGRAHALARVLRRLRRALLALPAARRRRAGSSTAACSGYVHGWIFDDGVRAADPRRHRRAHGLRDPRWRLRGLRLAARALQHHLRLRAGADRRRGSPQRARRARGRRAVRRRVTPARLLGLYALNAVHSSCWCASTPCVAPGRPGAGLSMWLVLALGELYILARHYLKLLFYASETAFFQGALAHAAYTAAPAVVWPDSPAAESIAQRRSRSGILSGRPVH